MKSEPTPISYFELFGLAEQFAIDTNLLNERYLALQQIIHPDIYANASASERLLALQKSSMLNEALRTLKHPLTRANYLLMRRGIEPNARPATINDSQFLMQQMQWQEALADAHDQDSITAIIHQLQVQYELLMQTLAQNLENEDLIVAQNTLHKLQFLNKLRHNAEELEIRLLETSTI